MSRRNAVLIFVALTGLGLPAWVALAPPRMPQAWREIEIGMLREDALQVTGSVNDMRELKGFDATGNTCRYLGIDYHWSLNIYYDDDGRVSELHARASNALSGFLDRDPWSK